MVYKLDLQTFASEFESHWVIYLYDLVPHLSKKLCKLLNNNLRYLAHCVWLETEQGGYSDYLGEGVKRTNLTWWANNSVSEYLKGNLRV